MGVLSLYIGQSPFAWSTCGNTDNAYCFVSESSFPAVKRKQVAMRGQEELKQRGKDMGIFMVEKVARKGGGIEEFSMPWEGVKERKLWNKKFFILETQPIFTWGVARKLVWEKMQKSEARFLGVVNLHRQTILMNVERDSTDHEDWRGFCCQLIIVY